MGYASESKNKGWGLPIGLLALILMIALMGTAGAPTPAFAANIGCGQCHGTYDNSADAGTNNPTDRRGVSAPGYESSTMLQSDNGKTGRGLHGIHMNYSSATYGSSGTQVVNSVTYTKRGNCNYCHNGHPRHATGFVNFTAAATIAPKATQPLLGNKYLMVYTSAGRGVSYKNNIPSLDDNAYGNCTKACHKGTSQANPAPWGNYTTAAVRLSCNSCHDDSSASTGGTALSGKHGAHITAIGGGNAACASCHNDNTGEGKPADDLGTKAYPHASNGTEVSSTNATLANNLSDGTTSKNNDASLVTCTAACHPRSNLIASPVKWDGTNAGCNMCHYYEAVPTAANNEAISAGSLPGAHSLHFNDGITCDKCHPVPSDYTHATNMPVSPTGVTFVAGLGVTGTGLDVTCQNTCHAAVSPSFNTTVAINGCAACHSYPSAPGRDWAATGNGHLVRHDAPVVNTHMKATGFNYLTDTFASATADTGKCGLCHRNVKHMNGSGFAHLSSATGSTYSQCGTTPFTFTVGGAGTGPSDNAKCSNVKCHSGKDTPVWW